MGAFWLHNQWGNNACSIMYDSLEWTASWYELTHNTPKHFQTCHKINNSIVSYQTVRDQKFFFYNRLMSRMLHLVQKSE